MSSSVRDGHFEQPPNSQFQFDLPRPVRKDQLIEYVSGREGMGRIVMIQVLVNLLDHLLANGLSHSSREVLSAMNLLEAQAITVSENFHKRTCH